MTLQVVYSPESLPVIKRNIASAILITTDGKIIMGRKNPQRQHTSLVRYGI